MACKSFIVLIRPSVVQQRTIRQNIGCGRFIYNKMLEERIDAYARLRGFFVRRLITKAEDAGKIVLEADKWFASTKTCHVCGEKNISIALSDREWDCPHCGTHHDRDHNAAVNLKLYGMKAVENIKVSRATSTNGKDKAGLPVDFQRDQCRVPLRNQENVSIPPVFSRRAC